MTDQQVVKIRGGDLVNSVLQESAIHDFETSLQGALRRPARPATTMLARSGTA
jgi:hypothetical protein